MTVLTKATVLACLAVASERREVLNRKWQAINPDASGLQEAFCMMATNVATAFEMEGEDHPSSVTIEPGGECRDK